MNSKCSNNRHFMIHVFSIEIECYGGGGSGGGGGDVVVWCGEHFR